MRVLVLFLLAHLPIALNLSADVLFIHGAKSKYSPWPKPGSFFYQQIEAVEQDLNGGEVFSLGWSGKSGLPHGLKRSIQEHLAAAERFANAIVLRYQKFLKTKRLQRKNSSPLTLIVHSNGGLIASLVSQMLWLDPTDKTENLFLPLYSLDAKPSASQKKNTVYKTIDAQALALRNLIAERIKRVRRMLIAKKCPQINIKQIIMIGTPFDPRFYAVNMNVVGKVALLFSLKDNIQPVFGLRRYPQGKNILNVRVAIKNTVGGVFYPKHTEMMYLKGTGFVRSLLTLFSDAQKALRKNDRELASIKAVDVLFSDVADEKPLFKEVVSLKEHAFKASGY